eukprot:jgi/Chlat1/1548/Chrsp122S00080
MSSSLSPPSSVAGRLLLPIVLLLAASTICHAWGPIGHEIIADIATHKLSNEASAAVRQLLASTKYGSLAAAANWADAVRDFLPWSYPLHFIDTPDLQCGYNASRDCYANGVRGACAAGAIWNYTIQLQTHSNFNLSQALMFLTHIVGDIHQPLHVAFTSDRGGNTIHVHFEGRVANLHQVWDERIIDHAKEKFFHNSPALVLQDLLQKLEGIWEPFVGKWDLCSGSRAPYTYVCPARYAVESVHLACKYAYAGAPDGAVLGDDYFQTRWPVVQLRLAQAGVRLAHILNGVFAAPSLALAS